MYQILLIDIYVIFNIINLLFSWRKAMYKYISAFIIASALIGCSSNTSPSSCSQWEVMIAPVSQLESTPKTTTEFNVKIAYTIPKGWEPIGSEGVGRWLILRKCVK
jgi:hypothetical protein